MYYFLEVTGAVHAWSYKIIFMQLSKQFLNTNRIFIGKVSHKHKAFQYVPAIAPHLLLIYYFKFNF